MMMRQIGEVEGDGGQFIVVEGDGGAPYRS